MIRLEKGKNDLATTRPDLAREWHPTKNKGIMPTDKTAQSTYRAWWLCGYGHEWDAPISWRNRGKGCPICTRDDR